MTKKFFFFLFGILFVTNYILAQKSTTSFIFGHSLINHEYQVNPTPSQETSVPHWMHFLAEEAGHSYKVSGQYGFLPQHVNLPPIAQWGFDYAEGAWDSDNEPFSDANFNYILLTPGNFIQWQAPSENYPQESISPLSATNTIFNWCDEQEDSLVFYIYENWPDMGPYLSNGFPPASTEWDTYNSYLNSDFHDWFIEYHDSLVENMSNKCVKMIPVGPIISTLLSQSPLDQIPIDSLYEDDAPHGRPTIYFLASLITYMATYEEPAPSNFQVDPIIHPIISENYQSIVSIIWDELNEFNHNDGSSRVFCGPLPQPQPSSNISIENKDVIISPVPANDFITINGLHKNHLFDIYRIDGKFLIAFGKIFPPENRINISQLPPGIYLINGFDENKHLLYQKKFVKF